jgi:hypothetical protein
MECYLRLTDANAPATAKGLALAPASIPRRAFVFSNATVDIPRNNFGCPEYVAVTRSAGNLALAVLTDDNAHRWFHRK